MNHRNRRFLLPCSAIACLGAGGVAFLPGPAASAADGTWTQNASGGLWSAGGNWSGGTIADGSGAANFNTIDISAEHTVHLDGDRTLNSLTFGDTGTGTAAGWVLDNNGTSTNNLILAGTTPTITVNPLGTGKVVEISAVIEGSAGLTKAGTGTLVLSGANTFTGNVNIFTTAGTVVATNSASFGSGTKTVAVQNGASTLKLDGTTGDISFASGISFNTSGLQAGGAIVNVAGNNTINGTFNLNSGATGTAIQVDGGSLTLAGAVQRGGSGTRGLSLQGNGNGSITGNIASTVLGGVVKSGSGTWSLGGNNAFTGGLTIQAGQLIAQSSANALGGSGTGAVALGHTSGTDNAALSLRTSSTFNNPITVASGSSGTATITNYANYSPTLAGSITLNKSLILANTNLSGANNLTVSGTVSGTGGLQINSTHADNTVTFSGTGNQSGTTSVTGGILVLNGTFTSASNTVTVATGAKLAGTGTVAGATTIQSGGKFSPGVVGAAGNQNFSDNLTFDSGSIFEWDLTSASTASGFDTVTGAPGKTFAASGGFRVVTDLDFSTGTFWQTNKTWNSIFNNFGATTGWSATAAAAVYSSTGVLRDVSSYGSFSITGSTLSFTAVPEPTSALAGILVTAGLLRRRRFTHIPG